MARVTLEIEDDLHTIVSGIAHKKDMDFDTGLNFLLERMLTGIPHYQPVRLSEYKPQRIPIMLDPTVDQQKKAFRCVNCGNVVFNYYGGVKLITNGQYDSYQNMVDGEEIDWFNKLGIPDEIMCSGRVTGYDDFGHKGKMRCKTVYYRIGV